MANKQVLTALNRLFYKLPPVVGTKEDTDLNGEWWAAELRDGNITVMWDKENHCFVDEIIKCPFKIGDIVKFNEKGLKMIFSRASTKSRFKVVKIGPNLTGLSEDGQMPAIHVQRIDIRKKAVYCYWPGFFTKAE